MSIEILLVGSIIKLDIVSNLIKECYLT